MDGIVSCMTDSYNIYTINKDRKILFLTHPNLVAYLHDLSKADGNDDYYARKALYLKKHGLLDKLNHRYEGSISPELVKKGISNLHQLVFEVTDSCNLRCKYCGYGELYNDYDARFTRKMKFEEAKSVIDFLVKTWNSSVQEFTNKTIFFSFYGGEPLLNMDLVKNVIAYIESLHIENRIISFSMTTNGMLLAQHMDFLAQKKFHLLISLDGNEKNNSYRIKPNGNNSFEEIIKNIDLLKDKYTEYFNDYVNFNAVLHNRNSVDNIFDFIYQRYGKAPRISPLNTTGIRPEKRDEFNMMYRNSTESLHSSPNYELILDKLFVNSGEYYDACLFLHQYNNNVYRTYNDLFYQYRDMNFIPTGTCTPFSRKLFVTVNGKIMACERIGQKFGLGKIGENQSVELSYTKIADLYNKYLDKLRKQCKVCYRSQSCMQCMFTIDGLDDYDDIKCPGFSNKKAFTEYVSRNLSFMERHPDAYERIMDVILF